MYTIFQTNFYYTGIVILQIIPPCEEYIMVHKKESQSRDSSFFSQYSPHNIRQVTSTLISTYHS